MEKLPEDLVDLIVGYLTLWDQLRWSFTCKNCTKKLHKYLTPWQPLFAAASSVSAKRRQRREQIIPLIKGQKGGTLGYVSIRATLVGPKQVGKTWSIIIYTTNGVPYYTPPTPEDFEANIMIDGVFCKVVLADTYSDMQPETVAKWTLSDVICLCYDRTRPSTVQELGPYLRMVHAVCGKDIIILALGIKEPLQLTSVRGPFVLHFLEVLAIADRLQDGECEALLKKEKLSRPYKEPLKIGTYQNGLKSSFDTMLRAVISQAYDEWQNQKSTKPCTIT